jgi:hypothetical protein
VLLLACGDDSASVKDTSTNVSASPSAVDSGPESTSSPTDSAERTSRPTPERTSTTAEPSSTVATTSAAVPTTAVSGRQLEAQLSVFFGGGPDQCFIEDDRAAPYVRLTSDDEPFVGQMVQLCAAGFGPGQLELSVTSPDGLEHDSTIEVVPSADIDRQVAAPFTGDRQLRAIEVDSNGEMSLIETEAWFLDASVPSGLYRLRVVQASVTASYAVTVNPESAPRIRSLTEGPGPGALTFAITGYQPLERVPVGIYRFVGERASGASQYDLEVALEPVQVDQRGFAVFAVDVKSLGLSPNPSADSNRDLCLISAGVDPTKKTAQCSPGWSLVPQSGFHGLPVPSLD